VFSGPGARSVSLAARPAAGGGIAGVQRVMMADIGASQRQSRQTVVPEASPVAGVMFQPVNRTMHCSQSAGIGAM
jgi:hypothetical protein